MLASARSAAGADVPDVRGDQLLFFYDTRALSSGQDGAAQRATFVNVLNPADSAIVVEVARYPVDLSSPSIISQTLLPGENHVFDVATAPLDGAGSAGLIVVTPIREQDGKRLPIVPPSRLGGSYTVAGPYNGFGENALARSVSGDRSPGAVVDGVEQRYELVRPPRGVLMVPTYYDPADLSDVDHDGNRVVLIAFQDRYEGGAWAGLAPPDPAPIIKPKFCSRQLGPIEGAAVEVSGVHLSDLATLAGAALDGSSGSAFFEADQAFLDAASGSLLGVFSQALGHLGAGHRLAVTTKVPACGTPTPPPTPTPTPIAIAICRNGRVEGNEECDGTNLGEARDCAGVIGGTNEITACGGELRCTDRCTYDVSACEPCPCTTDLECLVDVGCDSVRPGCGMIRVCHDGSCVPDDRASDEERRVYCDGVDPGNGQARCSEE